MFKTQQILSKCVKYATHLIVGLGVFFVMVFISSIQAQASTIDTMNPLELINTNELNDIHSRGWTIESDGKYHYINDDGSYKTGWLKVLERDYNYYSYLDINSDMDSYPYKAYLNSEGVKMTGWIFTDNKWFYFDKDGIMLSDANLNSYNISNDESLSEFASLRNSEGVSTSLTE